MGNLCEPIRKSTTNCIITITEIRKRFKRNDTIYYGCQAVHVDRTVLLTCGVYAISVDLGLSLRWLTTLADRTVILTCGVLQIQRTLKEHSPFPLSSSTNGKPYQRLPYLEVEENGLTRFIPIGACFPN
ncbi:hypothetical protein MTR_2g070800 [Medicago truncatula]|uniref:Uncharacterized protein n=1 Tax=Medicago truncatula TaxID=3880 RepID=A0A072VJX6_MEDTR|nr:hypothetical protein MTR_2g070800 [Medicago truncatula]